MIRLAPTDVGVLNDTVRKVGPFAGEAQWILTRGIRALEPEPIAAIVKVVQVFDAFTTDNDPY